MDYNKIGNFIMAERKAKKLTQAKLAEKLFVSEKTISKWENGHGIPDTNSLPKLCEIFEISLNELLNGERFSDESYINKAEEKLLDLQKIKEDGDKRLLSMEIVIGFLSITILLSLTLIAKFIEMENWIKIVLIVFGSVVAMIGIGFALKIEQVAGYYVCKKCNHKYIPTYKQVFWAPHINRTRYLKCPHCKQKSWNKKVVK
ncbi:MAG: helix-turn-helix domain-containing protein [Clostridia bacterium]|nr:helix-turn-helix domain-containing protein [Clostridia bacterium]